MRVPRIYTAQPLSAGARLALETDAAHHLARVLRMPVDAQLVLFNGDGAEYPARIAAIDKKNVVVTIERADASERESPLQIHLGIAVSKGERMDWVIQKATELGVTQISPLQSERVEVRLHGEREEKKRAHWQAITVAACEQCQRNRLPVVNTTQPLAGWLDAVVADEKFVLHHRSDTALADAVAKPRSVALLIGPEGGLSDSEIAQAERSGFNSLRLGPRVLRTETAPLAALSVLQFLWGDLR
jgi:16S rRNA (uracil1498-N3)-methyltransferase